MHDLEEYIRYFVFSWFLVDLDKETKAFCLVYVEILKDFEYSDNGGFSRLIYTHIYRHINVNRDKNSRDAKGNVLFNFCEFSFTCFIKRRFYLDFGGL